MEKFMTMAIARPVVPGSFCLTAERAMVTPSEVLFQAWTIGWDRWFAAPGTVLMRAEINAVFISKLSSRASAIRTTAASLDPNPTGWWS
jgi:hypothetical protein